MKLPLQWVILDVSFNNRFYYMTLSRKDWKLPKSRIWLAEIDIESGLDW